uniref:Histidine kinase/HSP90-like ATPase domain-containing protein n=1 Tax=Rhodosorus marinus TaxID=101924 RepID=A0A7S3EC88_9RHOD
MARYGSRRRRTPLILVLGLSLLLGLTYRVAAEPEEIQVTPPVSEEDEGAEKHEFQAETGRLMDIIVHSLYSNREIFIRELISNAADASDKLRMVKLSDEGSLEDDLDIRIAWHEEEKTISVTDKGIGMTKEDLVTNLGTIARSGTSSFLEKFKDAKDESSLIGQFGVGFYSSFLVANRVTVTSKHEDDSQYAWSSAADGVFTIEETEKAAEAERGTTVTLHLREDAFEFLDFTRLKELIRKYSAYIDFPIYLEEHKSEEVEVDVEDESTTEDKEASEDDEEEAPEDDREEIPEDDEEKHPSANSEEEQATDEDNSEDDDEINIEEDDYVDEEEHDPKKKWETRKYSEWQHVNDQKALWRRDPSEIKKNEYDEFYDSIKKSTEVTLFPVLLKTIFCAACVGFQID